MMIMHFENMDIREEITAKHVFYYQVADRLGISNSAFSKMMREPLSQEQRTKIENILASFDTPHKRNIEHE